MSLVYIAIRLLQDYPLEPLLFIQIDQALLFYQGSVYKLDGKLSDQLQLPLDLFSLRNGAPSCLALVELNKSVMQPRHLLWSSLIPIFASSPNVSRTSEFKDKRDAYVWGIPTWNFAELRAG